MLTMKLEQKSFDVVIIGADIALCRLDSSVTLDVFSVPKAYDIIQVNTDLLPSGRTYVFNPTQNC